MQTKKESLLSKIKQLLEEEGDWYKEMTYDEQEEIKTGLFQAENRGIQSEQRCVKTFR